MQQTPSIYQDRIVRIGSRQVLRDISFWSCTLAADPKSVLLLAENVHCTNCTFLYDGMEVNSAEWLALLQRQPLVPPAN